MSKASEWAAMHQRHDRERDNVKELPFFGIERFEVESPGQYLAVLFELTPKGELKTNPSAFNPRCVMTHDEALKLGHWLIATFGEGTP